MSEIIIKVQLDLSDAVKDFMAALIGKVAEPAITPVVERKAEPVAESTPEPVVEPTPSPVAEPTPVVESPSAVSREDLRQLVKSALIAEKEAGNDYAGGVKGILQKFGASNVTEVNEADFVALSTELTTYKNNLPPF